MVEEHRWYPVHTKPQSEWQARVHLKQQGFGTFLPFVLVNRVNGRRIDGVVRAWFPRYIFVEVPKGKSLRPVNSTVGVSTVLYVGGQPVTIPDAVIDDLKARCDPSGCVIDERREEPKPFAVGQRVKVTVGPFADFMGEIARIDGSKAIRVWVQLFGRKVETLIPPSGIAA